MIRYFTLVFFIIFSFSLKASDSFRYKIIISDDTELNNTQVQLWIQRFSNASFVKYEKDRNVFFFESANEINKEIFKSKLFKVDITVTTIEKTEEETFLDEYKNMTKEQQEKYHSEQKKMIVELEQKYNKQLK